MQHEDQGNNKLGNLPQNINHIISEGKDTGKEIIKFIKQDNQVIGYVLSSGEKVNVEQAIGLAKAGELKHVGVSISKSGKEYIRSLPDGDESNNLENLPSITQTE